MEYDLEKRRLIESCMVLSLISLMFTLGLSDAIIPNKSLARSESIHYEQKILWNQTYGGTRNDYADALIQTKDGGFALTGTTSQYDTSYYDMWLIKTDANGVAQWNKTFGGTDYDDASALIQTKDGGFALAGTTFSYGAGASDIWLIRMKSPPTLEALLAPLLSLNIFGLIILIIILFLLIVEIKKQKREK